MRRGDGRPPFPQPEKRLSTGSFRHFCLKVSVLIAVFEDRTSSDSATKYGKPFQPPPFPRTTTRVAPGGNPILFNAADSDIRLPPSRERGLLNYSYFIADQ